MSKKLSKFDEQRALRAFEEHCMYVKNKTAYNKDNDPKEQAARIKRAKKDISFFVQEYLPHYAKIKSPKFHIDASKIVKKHKYLRFISNWFRAAAKSVFWDIIVPMWLKIQDDDDSFNTMVLIGKSQASANKLLSDLQAEFEYNQRYIRDFGNQVQSGSWEEGDFMTEDGCAFFALGRKQSPRGLKKAANRPDYIVLDDIDDDELVNNESRVDDLVDWVNKALILSMDLGRGRVIFANNIIHDKSVTAKMRTKYLRLAKNQKSNKNSIHYEISNVYVYDKKGNITWPEKYTPEIIAEIEKELGYADAQTELHGNPISKGKHFKKKWVQFKKLPPLNSYKHLVAYFDGGYKNTGTSDSKALVLDGLIGAEYHTIKAYCGKATRMEAVEWHYDLFEYLRQRNAIAEFWMEEVFMLDLLYDDFDEAAITKGFAIPLRGDKRKKPDKDLRIKSMAGSWERGAKYFNAAEEDNHHMQNLIAQYMAFEPPKKTLKDGPDADEGAMFLLKENIITSQPPIIGLRTSNKYRY